jgi:spermidine synthase
VKPWSVIARAPAPDGGEMTLSRRDDELVIHVDGQWLMSSRSHGSEEAMAAAAGLAPGRGGAVVLVGGLGFGYTLAATLARVGPAGRVTVAEISAAVVDWNRGPAAALAGDPLADPRVTVARADVLALMRAADRAYDAILLDVDNGPWALSAAANRALYERPGLEAARRALRPGGTLVVWSAGPEPRFLRRLREAGFDARAEEVAAHGAGRRGTRHTLFVGATPRG